MQKKNRNIKKNNKQDQLSLTNTNKAIRKDFGGVNIFQHFNYVMCNRKVPSETGIAISSEAPRVLVYRNYHRSNGNEEAITHHLAKICRSLTIGSKTLTAYWADTFTPPEKLEHLEINEFDKRTKTHGRGLNTILQKCCNVPCISIHNWSTDLESYALEIENLACVFTRCVRGLQIEGTYAFFFFLLLCVLLLIFEVRRTKTKQV